MGILWYQDIGPNSLKSLGGTKADVKILLDILLQKHLQTGRTLVSLNLMFKTSAEDFVTSEMLQKSFIYWPEV